jgi:hypothetical protein
MSKPLRALALATSVACLSLSAHADQVVTLTFEGLAASASSTGVAAGNNYASSGLSFSAGVNVFNATNNSNYKAPAAGNGVGFIGNVLPANTFRIDILNTFVLSGSFLDFDAASKGGASVSVCSNVDGCVDPVEVIQGGSQLTWSNWGHHHIDISGLTSVDYITFSAGANALFAVDNLQYTLTSSPTPNHVPEPAGFGLVALALAGLGLTARRKKA